MNAALLLEVLAKRGNDPQGYLPLAAEGVLRYVWECRYGPMLIEVQDGKVFVNGKVVEPASTLTPGGKP